MVMTWMIAGNMSIAACKLQLSVHSCNPKYQPIMGGSLKICQLTQLQASVTQDYFDKAEEESINQFECTGYQVPRRSLAGNRKKTNAVFL